MIIIKKNNNLEQIRKEYNKTQTEMADMMGISLQRYSNYEKKRRKLPVELAKIVSDKFDLPLEAIFFEKELFVALSKDNNKQTA